MKFGTYRTQDVSFVEEVEEYDRQKSHRIKDVSFIEEVEEYEEEVVFREDEAWKKSIRKTHLAPNDLSNTKSKAINNFNQDLHQTLEWMKNTRNLEKLVLNVSDRSREFESFFPTFTPTFLGNAITDDDLDRVLSEFQTIPRKKKKKKKKTLPKAESQVTLTEEDTLYSEFIETEGPKDPEDGVMSDKHAIIFEALKEYKDQIDFSKVRIKGSENKEWSIETRSRLYGILLARNDISSIQCFTVRLGRLQDVKRVLDSKLRVYGVCYTEKISPDMAKLVTPFSVDDKRWSQSILELQQSEGWITYIVDADENTLRDLKKLTIQIKLEFLFPITAAQNLRHISFLFDENVALEFIPIKEEDIAKKASAIFIISCVAFIDLGKILSLVQRDGFSLTGMHTIRINKTHINVMFSQSLCDQDFSPVKNQITKTFCHGPSIVLSLHKNRAISSLKSILASNYEKYLDTKVLFSDKIIMPLDDYMSDNWSRLFFPHGPISDIKYSQIGNQFIHKSFPLYFHITGKSSDAPNNHRNYTIIFLSFSNRISENLEAWGDILSNILRFRSGSVQIRIENCNLVNCSAKVAREFASGCDLDPLGTLRLIHMLRNGYCLMMRLGTTQALFKMLYETDILKNPHVFYLPQLDGLYNRLSI